MKRKLPTKTKKGTIKNKKKKIQPKVNPLLVGESFHPEVVWDLNYSKYYVLLKDEDFMQLFDPKILRLILEYAIGEPIYINRQTINIGFWKLILEQLLNPILAIEYRRSWSCYLVSSTHCLFFHCSYDRSFHLIPLKGNFDELPIENRQSYEKLMNSNMIPTFHPSSQRIIIYNQYTEEQFDFDEELAKMCHDLQLICVPDTLEEHEKMVWISKEAFEILNPNKKKFLKRIPLSSRVKVASFLLSIKT